MSRVYLTFEGADNVVASLLKLEGVIEENAKIALKNALQPIVMTMKSNATSAFNKGYSKGIMVNSIDSKVATRKDKETIPEGLVLASVGVYDVANTGVGDYGMVSGRRITAPMLAMFYEAGIQPHGTSAADRAPQRATEFSRARPGRFGNQHKERNNKRKDQGRDEMKLHPGSAPIPFISSAGESMLPGVIDQMDAEVAKMMDKLL